MYTFDKINFNKIDDKNICFLNCNEIYTTYDWLNFLKKTCNVDIIILKILKDKKLVGYFYGGLFKKFGIRIIGSPFNGWNTPYMGFSMIDKKVNQNDILLDLWNFLKKEYKILYFEVCDKKFNYSDLISKKIKVRYGKTYTLNIDRPDNELLEGFTKHCRKNLKLFINRGASIISVDYNKKFLDDFYIMLEGVFNFQNLNPPYSKEKLEILFNSIKSENILCLKALNPDEKCIGMSVSFGFKDSCYAFASGTLREENYNQKNYLRWEAIRYWRSKGKKHYDLMGLRNYKLEFNPIEESYCIACFSKFRVFFVLKQIAKKMFWLMNKINYKLKKFKKKSY